MDKYLKALGSDIFTLEEKSHIKGVYDFANLITDLNNTNFFTEKSIHRINFEISSLYATMNVNKREHHAVVAKIHCYDDVNDENDFYNEKLKETLFSVKSPIQNIYNSLMAPDKYSYRKISLILDDTLKTQVFEKLIDPTFNKMIEVRLLDNDLKNEAEANIKSGFKRKI